MCRGGDHFSSHNIWHTQFLKPLCKTFQKLKLQIYDYITHLSRSLERERERDPLDYSLKLKCEPIAGYGTWLWQKRYYLMFKVVPFGFQFRGGPRKQPTGVMLWNIMNLEVQRTRQPSKLKSIVYRCNGEVLCNLKTPLNLSRDYYPSLLFFFSQSWSWFTLSFDFMNSFR